MDTKLREGIHWVGYVDWNVRDFHGYRTHSGSTYKSYIVCDEKVAVIDAVKAPYADRLLSNIKSHTSLEKVDYLVVNHAEPDHSGGVPAVMAEKQTSLRSLKRIQDFGSPYMSR